MAVPGARSWCGTPTANQKRASQELGLVLDQLRLIGIRECREVGEREMIQRTALEKYVSAPQSTAASFVRREFKRHLFVVGSLDKQMQNEKELIRLANAGMGGLFLYLCRLCAVWGVGSI